MATGQPCVKKAW